jgi:putative copper resistance protein D
MLLQGAVVFRLFVAGPVFTPATPFGRFDGRLLRLTLWSLGVGLISGFLWWCSVAIRMSDANLNSALQPEAFRILVWRTQFSQLWDARLALAAAFVALFLIGKRWARFGQLLLAMAVLATLSVAGHAGAGIGKGHWIHLVDDAFHLVAAGVWPAGLAPFAIFLSQALQATELREIQVASLITQRFSSVSLVTVGALAMTGAINGYFLVGTFHGLIGTTYGRLLVLKSGVFVLMMVIGALNLLWLRPRIVVAAQSAALEESLNLFRSLRRNVVAELFLGVILMIVVGVLGVTPPAAHSGMSSGANIRHHENGTFMARSAKD